MDSIAKAGTMLRIACAVNQPIRKVTVDEICANAGISKPTFYRHFESKHEVIPWLIAWCDDITVARIGTSFTWEEALARATTLYRRFNTTLACSDKDNGNIRTCLQYYDVRHLEHSLCSTIGRRQGAIDDGMRFCIRSFAYMKREILLSACRSGEAFDADSLAAVPSAPDETCQS